MFEDEATEDRDPNELVICPSCQKQRAWSYMGPVPVGSGSLEGAGSPDQMACVTCLEGIQIEGHFMPEWWQMIGRFCIAYEGCAARIASFSLRLRLAKNITDKLESSTTRMVSKVIGILGEEDRQRDNEQGEEPDHKAKRKERLQREVKLLKRYLKLIENRNWILHSEWMFPESADPRDETPTSDVLEAADHKTSEERRITFEQLEKYVEEAEAIRADLKCFRWRFVKAVGLIAKAPPANAPT